MLDRSLSVSYLDPITLSRHAIAPSGGDQATGCSGKSSGWVSNLATNRVQICGTDCDDLRQVLKVGGETAAALGQPPPAVPVYLTNCGGVSMSGAGGGGGTGFGGGADGSTAVADATAKDSSFSEGGTKTDAGAPPDDAGPQPGDAASVEAAAFDAN